MKASIEKKLACVGWISSVTVVNSYVGMLIGLGLTVVSVPAFAQTAGRDNSYCSETRTINAGTRVNGCRV